MSAADHGSAPTIVFADNHLLVIAKPAGMPTQDDASRDLSLLAWAKAEIKRTHGKPGEVFLGLVHRLDRPTSGLLVLARTSKAASRLSAAMRERRVRKRYLARCEEMPAAPEGLVEGWLAPGVDGASSRIVAASHPRAQAVALRFAVLQAGPAPLLVVELLTGRKHQIRAQLAELGAPIVGDLRYGAKPTGSGSIAVPPYAIGLHSYELELPHPIGGGLLRWRAPAPAWLGPVPEPLMDPSPPA